MFRITVTMYTRCTLVATLSRLKFHDKLPRGRGSVARRGIEGFREKNELFYSPDHHRLLVEKIWIEKIDK